MLNKYEIKPGRYPKVPRLGEPYRPPMRGGYAYKGPTTAADKRTYDELHAAFLAGRIREFGFEHASRRFTADGEEITPTLVHARWGELDGTALYAEHLAPTRRPVLVGAVLAGDTSPLAPAPGPAETIAPVIPLRRAPELDEILERDPSQRVCVLTGDAGEEWDDCSTHEHEPA